jgi:hypothetical protein
VGQGTVGDRQGRQRYHRRGQRGEHQPHPLPRLLLRQKTETVTSSISKSVAKAKAKIRINRNRYEYWIAEYVEFSNGTGTFIPTIGISFSRAISYVRSGGNVFAASQTSAYKLAFSVGNGMKPTRPEIHSDVNGSTLGYWMHYHDAARKGGHVFYVT